VFGKGEDPKAHAPWHVAFSPDGRLAAGLGGAKGLGLWETATGRPRLQVEVSWDDPRAVDGERARVSGPPSEAVRTLLFSAAGTPLGRFAGHDSRVIAVRFSADGKRLLSGSEDATALVWDVARLRALGGRGRTAAPTATRLGALWADLAGEDGERAGRALAA